MIQEFLSNIPSSYIITVLSTQMFDSLSIKLHYWPYYYSISIIRFIIPIVLIIKLDWNVCICLTQLYDDRDMYRIYYLKNYMFRPFTLAIFMLRKEILSTQLYSNYVGCIRWGGKR